jgi:uncharacterized protein
MIRLLLLAVLFFLAYTLWGALARLLTHRPGPPPEKTDQGEEMVRDPQCGTYLPRGEALTRTVKGRRYYFCSSECRDAFKG